MRFVLLDSSAGLAKGQEIPPIVLTLTFENDLDLLAVYRTRLTCRLPLNEVRFDVTANRSSMDLNLFPYFKLITQKVICHKKIFKRL